MQIRSDNQLVLHLTGTNLDTDQDGNILEAIDYYPFGSARVDDKSGSYENNYKYTGKELDEDTGLYYYGARYYDAEIGRWAGEDPASQNNPEQFLADPQQLNFYSYVRNNPILYNDPSGKCAWDLCIGEGAAAISAAEVAIAGVATLSTVITAQYAKQQMHWPQGNQTYPNIFNPERADDTKMFPNGMPPKMSNWKKMIIGLTVLGSIAKDIKETYDGIKEDWEKNDNNDNDINKNQVKNDQVIIKMPDKDKQVIKSANNSNMTRSENNFNPNKHQGNSNEMCQSVSTDKKYFNNPYKK